MDWMSDLVIKFQPKVYCLS